MKLSMMLAETFDSKGFFGEITTLLIVVFAIVGAFFALSVVAALWHLILMLKYRKYNKRQASTEMTGAEVARKMLEGLGINDVEVVKCNFISAIFLGNSYSPFKKRIRLRKNIYDKKTLTAVAMATQKVALAKRDHDGDKKLKTRSVFMTFGYFAPFAVLPLVVIGLLIDFLTASQNYIGTIVLSAIALVFYIASFIVLCLNIPIEKRANKDALEFMQKTGILTEQELADAKDLFKTYLTMHVLDFVVELLYLLWRILEFIVKVSNFAAKNKK